MRDKRSMKRFAWTIAGGALAIAGLSAGARSLAQDPGQEPKAARSRDELLSAIFGSDRDARRKACAEATAAKALTEDDWLKLFDATFASDDEREEAWFLAGQGIEPVVTWRSHAKLLELSAQEPKALVNVPDDHHGPPHKAPKWMFKWAVNRAIWKLQGPALEAPIDARLSGLSPELQAETLLSLWLEKDESYRRLRPKDLPLPDELSAWWHSRLLGRLAALADDSATVLWAAAKALPKISDRRDREELIQHLFERYIKRAEAGDKDVQEAAKALLKAVLANPVAADASFDNERLAFVLPCSAIKDLDAELIAYLEGTKTQPGVYTGWAMQALAECRTERGADFMVAWRGPILSGPGSPIDLCSALLAPRLIAALEKESATPSSDRFQELLDRTLPALAPDVRHVEVDGMLHEEDVWPDDAKDPSWRDRYRGFDASLKAILARVERALVALDGDAKNAAAAANDKSARERAVLKSETYWLKRALDLVRRALASKTSSPPGGR